MCPFRCGGSKKTSVDGRRSGLTIEQSDDLIGVEFVQAKKLLADLRRRADAAQRGLVDRERGLYDGAPVP
jgi:hypothetical protein